MPMTPRRGAASTSGPIREQDLQEGSSHCAPPGPDRAVAGVIDALVPGTGAVDVAGAGLLLAPAPRRMTMTRSILFSCLLLAAPPFAADAARAMSGKNE